MPNSLILVGPMGPRLKAVVVLVVLGSFETFERLSESDGSIRYNRECEKPFTHTFKKCEIFLIHSTGGATILGVVHCDRALNSKNNGHYTMVV